MYVMHTEVTTVSSEFGMHHGSAIGKSEEILLNPSFMADIITKKVGRQVPVPQELQVSKGCRIQLGPTHELRLSSFKTFWFYDSQPFLKRIRVVREARIMTLFISEKQVQNTKCRFSITCLPHAHLNAFDVYNKYTGYQGGCCTTKAKKVFSTKTCGLTDGPDLKAIVWNISNIVHHNLEKSLYFLVTHEDPSLIMLVGAHLGGKFATVANALGFNKVIAYKGSDGRMNGTTVLWNNESIILQHNRRTTTPCIFV